MYFRLKRSAGQAARAARSARATYRPVGTPCSRNSPPRSKTSAGNFRRCHANQLIARLAGEVRRAGKMPDERAVALWAPGPLSVAACPSSLHIRHPNAFGKKRTGGLDESSVAHFAHRSANPGTSSKPRASWHRPKQRLSKVEAKYNLDAEPASHKLRSRGGGRRGRQTGGGGGRCTGR